MENKLNYDPHHGANCYFDRDLRREYVAEYKTILRLGFGAVTEMHRTTSEKYSEKCWSFGLGYVKSRNSFHWSIPSITGASFNIEINAFSRIDSFCSIIGNAGDIASISVIQLPRTKKYAWDFDWSNQLRIEIIFQKALPADKAVDVTEDVVEFFNFMGASGLVKNVSFISRQPLMYFRHSEKNWHIPRIKYVHNNLEPAIKMYPLWEKTFLPASGHFYSLLRNFNQVHDDISSWDSSTWLVKSFDWFEGTLRSIVHTHQPVRMSIAKQKGLLYLANIDALISESQTWIQATRTKNYFPLPWFHHELNELFSLKLEDPLTIFLQSARILRNKDHHTLIRNAEHGRVTVSKEYTMHLVALLINVTWFMLMTQFQLYRLEDSYIIDHNLKECDWDVYRDGVWISPWPQ